ncbi:MAG TPA: S8 family serine peptidase, partial [Thermoanaerobaculia bacterium]|nr:S8 family serine peptidase [Thermoanaerobaculia bacterium]
GGDSRVLRDAIDKARDSGILVVAAAGNDTHDIDKGEMAIYPAAYNAANVISVMASTCDQKVATFSNCGEKRVHLAAPGDGPRGILSTVLNNHYAYWRGTSMSAAFVAGAAALVKSQHKNWKAVEVKQRLLSSVTKLPGLRALCVSEGRLNLEAALTEPRSLGHRFWRRFRHLLGSGRE